MIHRQLKLRLTKQQEAILEEWLWVLTGMWNWGVRKIELDANDGIFHSRFSFTGMLVGHGSRLGIPTRVIDAHLETIWRSWDRCFRKKARRPRLKGQRNRLNSVPCKYPLRLLDETHVSFPFFGSLKFFRDQIPEGRIKQSRLVKRASGWHLCLFIEAEVEPIAATENGVIGIDFGFRHLATTSEGEQIEHPKELAAASERLAQAHRGRRKKLMARLEERERNRRKDRNHKLSRRLVAENKTIVVSKDSLRGLSQNHFGKSVRSAAHGELRSMLAYKCTASGRRYIEVSPKNSTRACSSCGCLTGPTGWAGLKVRAWECVSCGAQHDRDVNAAINTLKLGLGSEPRKSGRPLVWNSVGEARKEQSE